jgi:ABC-2 type transport system ATP-binding protein
VQHVADRVALVRDGRLELVEAVERLRARARGRVEVTFAAPPPPAAAFADVPGVRELGRRGDVVTLSLEGEFDPLLKALSRHRVVAHDSQEADQEDGFLDLYRTETARAA